MLATQVAGAATLATVPVLAPEIARDFGIATGFVGVYTGLLFAAATLALVVSGAVIARIGAVRANQVAAAGSALALLIVLIPGWWTLMVSAVFVGLAYGPNTPSSSQVLSRVVPYDRQGFAFSLKQSGAPLGGMLAGVCLPLVVVAYSWQWALVGVVVTAVVISLLVQPLQRELDLVGHDHRTERKPSPLASLRTVIGRRRLRYLVIGGFLLMLGHAFFQTFYVTYLVDGVGFTLTQAGVLFGILQVAGAASRVGFGWLADRLGGARSVVIAVAILGVIANLLVANLHDRMHFGVLAVISVLAGAGSSGWYGIFLAELANRAQATAVGMVTGGALFFIYLAVVVGPLLVSTALALTQSYLPAIGFVAGCSVAAIVLFSLVWE